MTNIKFKDIKKFHAGRFNKRVQAWEIAHQEAKNPECESLKKLHRLLAEKGKTIDDLIRPESKVIQFPNRTIELGSTDLMAAAPKDGLAEWLAQNIFIKSAGFELDIRRVLGSDNEVDVYIHPKGDDPSLIEKTLSPFKGKTIQVRFSVDDIEVLMAEIYVDENGSSAEGSGYLTSSEPQNLLGQLNIEVIEID